MNAPASRAGIAARLRTDTRAAHDAIERALDWEQRASSRAAYRRWLERLHGFHRVWEPAVASALADPAFFDPRRKLHLLAGDLAALGVTPAEIDVLPPAPVSLPLAGCADALGSLYVLEGSMLGGQLIARHVLDTLGFRPRYHLAYGEATGTMWRSFRARLDRDVAPETYPRAVAAAERTFAELGSWIAG